MKCKFFNRLSGDYGKCEMDEELAFRVACGGEIKKCLRGRIKNNYPQAKESNEYRHLDPKWLDEIATGLTAGAEKHPGETWKSIPAEEHAARAIRHLNLFRSGDRVENHLVNASMRCMMAYVVDKAKGDEG